MLKYLIVQLDDSSVSFCHYTNDLKATKLIATEILEKAVIWAMKENLTIQYLYPSYALPSEYAQIIGKTYHADIVPSNCEDTALLADADVVVYDNWQAFINADYLDEQAYVIRTSIADLLANCDALCSVMPKLNRLNVVIADVADFSQEADYAKFLDRLAKAVAEEYKNGHAAQINLLTDRIFLDSMNNCNAGDETITLAPDGRFYICPAFYSDGENGYAVGDIESGLDIRNRQLYGLKFAPICRECDAFQCRRCVWWNRKLTLEVNTPSRQQCVMAHLERNASQALSAQIADYVPTKEIPEIDYLDPFELVIKNK